MKIQVMKKANNFIILIVMLLCCMNLISQERQQEDCTIYKLLYDTLCKDLGGKFLVYYQTNDSVSALNMIKNLKGYGKLGDSYRLKNKKILFLDFCFDSLLIVKDSILDTFFKRVKIQTHDGESYWNPSAWDEFHQYFPDNKGYIIFSQIGYYKNRALLVYSYLYDWIGGGCSVELVKKRGKWVIKKENLMWAG